MKEATTPYQIAMEQRENKIDNEFLIGMGFELVNEYPLKNIYRHTIEQLVYCSIGLYGELFIGEKHWCNDDYERVFTTINPSLDQTDFTLLLVMLNIKLPLTPKTTEK